MKEFIEMLKKIKPNVDFENEEALVDDGILESLDIISIISEIADKYGVVIPSDEIIPDNFNSAIALYELVEDLKQDLKVESDISGIKTCVYVIYTGFLKCTDVHINKFLKEQHFTVDI